MTAADSRLTVAKYSATGNDFLLIDVRGQDLEDPAALARALCRRRHSLGADGLLLIEPVATGEGIGANVRMRLWNADGSPAELSGNGARCAARYAVDAGLGPAELTLATDAGPVSAVVDGSDVRIRLPGTAEVEPGRRLRVEGRDLLGTAVRVGVPVFVLPHDDPDDLPVRFLGRAVRNHADFGREGTNVVFVRVDDEQELYLRIYERGVEDETLSSGTGCTGAALAMAAQERAVSPVICHTRGGDLTVRFRRLEEDGIPPSATGEDGSRPTATAEDGDPEDGDDGEAEEGDAAGEGNEDEGGVRIAFGDLELEGPTRRVYTAETFPEALSGC